MKKRVTSILLTVCMLTALLSNFSITAFAGPSDVYYEELGIWFNPDEGVVSDCDEEITRLIIPGEIDGVTVKAIWSGAFRGHTKLKELVLPDTVERLGDHILEGTGVSKITIPQSVVSAGNEYGGPFAGAEKLTEIVLEDGMECIPDNLLIGAAHIESITIPQSVTSIGFAAFRDCAALKSITIPESVTYIGMWAFENCTSLEKITIPGTVEELGMRTFGGCTALKQAVIQPGVKILGAVTFGGCVNLEYVSLPDTIEELGGTFYNCSKLKSVHIPSKITKIDDHTFYGCASLEVVTIPEGVTEIDNKAFAECSNLKAVYLPSSVDYIGDDAFKNCDKLTVYVNENCYGITYIIDNGIKYSIIKDITSYKSFVYKNTDYYMSTDILSGYAKLVFKYKVKEDVKTTHLNIYIMLPENIELIANSVRLNGFPFADYDLYGNQLTYHTLDRQGEFSFCVRADEYTRFVSYGLLTGGVTDYPEVIGVVDVPMPALSLNVESITNTPAINVTGVTLPSKTVDLYIDGAYAKSVTAKKSGRYSAELVLPNPEQYSKYTITAHINKVGTDISQDKVVTYDSSVPMLNSLIMGYNGKNYNLTEQDGVKSAITFNSSDYQFCAKLDNPSAIENLAFVSTRGNQKKYIDATYDPETGCYVAKGFFDEENHDYVPGSITVEYTKKRKEVPVTNVFDVMGIMGSVHSSVGDFTTNVTTNTDELYEATVGVTSDLQTYLGSAINLSVQTTDADYQNISEDDLMKNEDDYYSYAIEDGGKRYILNLDYTDDEEIRMIAHDISSSKQISYSLNFMDTVTGSDSPKIRNASEVLGKAGFVSGVINDVYDIECDDDALNDRIMSASMTEEDRQTALKKAKELKRDRETFVLTSTVITALTMGAGGPPGMVFGLLYGAITLTSDYFWDMRMANILGGDIFFDCKWIVDPSGYVYEVVPSNRVEGVTASAYWITPEYIDENGIGNEAQKIFWDAYEYDQINPLITDAEGNYAWDVPEGLWQVEFEKEGYETVKTDWLPVPPPQTDVNVCMVSNLPPEIEKAEWDGENLCVRFNRPVKENTIENIELLNADKQNIDYYVMCNYDHYAYYNDETVCSEFIFSPTEKPLYVSANGNVKSYADAQMADAIIDVISVEKSVRYDCKTNTITIVNNEAYSNACVCIAGYQGDKLVSMQYLPKDVAVGETTFEATGFTSAGADIVKVMVWEDAVNMTPLCMPCVEYIF